MGPLRCLFPFTLEAHHACQRQQGGSPGDDAKAGVVAHPVDHHAPEGRPQTDGRVKGEVESGVGRAPAVRRRQPHRFRTQNHPDDAVRRAEDAAADQDARHGAHQGQRPAEQGHQRQPRQQEPQGPEPLHPPGAHQPDADDHHRRHHEEAPGHPGGEAPMDDVQGHKAHDAAQQEQEQAHKNRGQQGSPLEEAALFLLLGLGTLIARGPLVADGRRQQQCQQAYAAHHQQGFLVPHRRQNHRRQGRTDGAGHRLAHAEVADALRQPFLGDHVGGGGIVGGVRRGIAHAHQDAAHRQRRDSGNQPREQAPQAEQQAAQQHHDPAADFVC